MLAFYETGWYINRFIILLAQRKPRHSIFALRTNRHETKMFGNQTISAHCNYTIHPQWEIRNLRFYLLVIRVYNSFLNIWLLIIGLKIVPSNFRCDVQRFMIWETFWEHFKVRQPANNSETSCGRCFSLRMPCRRQMVFVMDTDKYTTAVHTECSYLECEYRTSRWCLMVIY